MEWDAEAESYSANCPELNFVSSYGKSQEAAIASLKDAIQLLLKPLPDHLLEMQSTADVVELAL